MKILDPEGKAEIVINLQGDFPTITPDTIRSVLPPLADPAVDILDAGVRHSHRGRRPRSERGEGDWLPDRSAAVARVVLHARHGAVGRRAALPSYRPLCLSPRGTGAFCPASAIAARAPGKAGATPGAGGRHDGSTSPSSTRCPAASIPRPISKPRARCWPNPERLIQGAP